MQASTRLNACITRFGEFLKKLIGPPRERAELQGVSLNQALIDSLRSGLGDEPPSGKKRDLATIFDGTPLEPEVIAILEEQRRIDPEVWR